MLVLIQEDFHFFVFEEIQSILKQVMLNKVAFNSLSTTDKKAEFANSVDLGEVAHNEPPHLDLHCLPSSL